jgi:type IV pilus assembly protein PilY1
MSYQTSHKPVKKPSYTKALSLLCVLIFSSHSMAEGVYFSDTPYYTFKGRTPHVILPLSVEYPIIGNAWRYDAILQNLDLGGGNKLSNIPVGYARRYEKSLNIGLFNPLLCYKYDNSAKYFYPFSAAELKGENILCGDGQKFSGIFSGSMMNWATHSTLDLLRYALTGGSRLIDLSKNDLKNSASTVVRRANILPVMDEYF